MAGAFLAADWGTTNLRVWRVGEGGDVEARADLPLGVSRLAPGEAATCFEAEIRPAVGAETLPALLCGMVGSNIGWTLAPYLDCPASVESLAAGLKTAAPGVRIVPGLRCEGLAGPDVMRGEETQVLGWLAADPARRSGRHLLCLPGTHSKWLRLHDGLVSRFVTAMTGELYDLLGHHGVLKFAAPDHGREAFDLAAFDAGAAAAGDGGALAARLFNLRGLGLAGRLAAEAAPAWLSGLLIGAEVAALRPLLADGDAEPVQVIAGARLGELYGRVLAARGVRFHLQDGDALALAGLIHIWNALA